uniref:Uncharacterized protein n=1 Tax=Chrysotila carterae TaxID=13221 RepID=A0A7S4BNU5_CHRCT
MCARPHACLCSQDDRSSRHSRPSQIEVACARKDHPAIGDAVESGGTMGLGPISFPPPPPQRARCYTLETVSCAESCGGAQNAALRQLASAQVADARSRAQSSAAAKRSGGSPPNITVVQTSERDRNGMQVIEQPDMPSGRLACNANVSDSPTKEAADWLIGMLSEPSEDRAGAHSSSHGSSPSNWFSDVSSDAALSRVSSYRPLDPLTSCIQQAGCTGAACGAPPTASCMEMQQQWLQSQFEGRSSLDNASDRIQRARSDARSRARSTAFEGDVSVAVNYPQQGQSAASHDAPQCFRL